MPGMRGQAMLSLPCPLSGWLVTRKAGVDHGPRVEPAVGLEAGVDLRCRHFGEAARVKTLQFAFGHEGARRFEIEFGLGDQAGVAGRELQLRQVDALAAVTW